MKTDVTFDAPFHGDGRTYGRFSAPITARVDLASDEVELVEVHEDAHGFLLVEGWQEKARDAAIAQAESEGILCSGCGEFAERCDCHVCESCAKRAGYRRGETRGEVRDFICLACGEINADDPNHCDGCDRDAADVGPVTVYPIEDIDTGERSRARYCATCAHIARVAPDRCRLVEETATATAAAA